MTLSDAVVQAQSAGATNIPDIIRYLTRKPVTRTERTEDVTKPAEQVEAEQAARNTLLALVQVLDPDGDAKATLAKAQAASWHKFVRWIKPRLASLSDAQKQMAQVAFAELTAAYLGHQRAGYDWTATTWGEATERRTVFDREEGQSIAESNGLTVTRDTIKAELRKAT